MISPISFTGEHIKSFKKQHNQLDQNLIERTIFAFGLLEALVKVKLPFIFKGGTSLMLIMSNSYRLSTDIDILISPNCDIDSYLIAAAEIFPFYKMEEHTRIGKNNIVKRHFKYYYKSPTSNNEIPIILDVVYSNNCYSKIVESEINHKLLNQDGRPLLVNTPSLESILGDKLTAFAPHTIGVEFEYENNNGIVIRKHLEVIKQFLDISQLAKEAKYYEDIKNTYFAIAKQEIGYRGENISPEECLLDTFKASLSIFSRGSIFRDDYPNLLSGIQRIQNHIFGITFNGQSAFQNAAEVMLIVSKIITGKEVVKILDQPLFIVSKFRSLNNIKKINNHAFNIAAIAMKMIEDKLGLGKII